MGKENKTEDDGKLHREDEASKIYSRAQHPVVTRPGEDQSLAATGTCKEAARLGVRQRMERLPLGPGSSNMILVTSHSGTKEYDDDIV